MAASASVRWSSTLLAASTTGFRLRRSTWTTASSTSWVPTVASTTKTTASAAVDGQLGLLGDLGGHALVASGAQPPVSTTTNWPAVPRAS